MRAKQAVADEIKIDRTLTRGDGTSGTDSKRSRTSAWAALIQRVYEADPLTCPRCGAKKKVVSFIETRQRDVTCWPAGRQVEKILRGHQSGAMVDGLREGPLRTLAQPRAPPKRGTRWKEDEPRELQLVLDPEFLSFIFKGRVGAGGEVRAESLWKRPVRPQKPELAGPSTVPRASSRSFFRQTSEIRMEWPKCGANWEEFLPPDCPARYPQAPPGELEYLSVTSRSTPASAGGICERTWGLLHDGQPMGERTRKAIMPCSTATSGTR